RRPHRMATEPAHERLFQLAAPAFHSGAGGARLIAQIVTVPHEGVNGAHCPTLLRRKQQERVIEVFGSPAPDTSAVIVGAVYFAPGRSHRIGTILGRSLSLRSRQK